MRLPRGPVIGALATCLALSSTLTGTALAGSSGSPQARADAKTTPTPFGLSAGAYGSRAQGGDLPANSGRTAFTYLGCTKLAGRNTTNSRVGVGLGEADLQGVRTRTWTTRAQTGNGVAVSSHARTRIASVDLGALRIRGLRLSTRAFHDDRGFRTERDLSFERIRLAGQALPALLDPDPGDTLRVAGIGRVTFLSGTRRSDANGAQLFARGLQVDLAGTDTTLTIANATSRISNGVPAGILGGYGRAANVRLVDGAVRSGKVAVQPLPCTGTDNKWLVNDTAGFDLPGVLRIGAATGSARGDQVSRTDAYGQTRGRIARVRLGDQLVIGGIVAQAKVTKTGQDLTRSIEGTTVGFIRFEGADQEIPNPGQTLEIPGVARIRVAKRTRSEFGIKVVAVQVKVLDDTEVPGTLKLGEAFARIKRN